MSNQLNPVRTLLGDMAQDEYIRFKYGKRVEAALKALDQATTGPDLGEVEARLVEALEALRGGKKGGGASASGPKSPRKPRATAAPAPALT